MRRERLNEWPGRDSRRDLHVHEARRLILVAMIQVEDLPAEVAASFSKVCEWRREHDYEAHMFPHREAKEMYEAAFGVNGVVTWVEARV